MDAKQFREAVQEMRRLQKWYYKTRSLNDLVKCKEAEKKVDEHLADIEREKHAQKSLF
jgi:hypothetical protein